MFSRRDEGRIVKTVRRVEAMPDVVSTHRATGNAVVPEVRVVRITSTTLSAGRYPAELQYRNPSTGVWGSFSPAVVVHVEPLAGETLTAGLIQAQRSGATAAGIQIFTPVEGSGSIDATKRYCRVATTANISLSSDLENGDTLNGVTLATGDRVLVKDQSTPSQNGIYVVAATGTAARATDADSWDELVGALVVVSEGTAKADTLWLCTSNAGGTLGSTSVTWAQVGAGITVQDGAPSTSFTGVTIVQFGAEAYLNAFNPFLLTEPTAGTARVRLRVADRDNAGGVSHDEATLGYQEFGGVKAFVHPLIVGAQNPTGGELGGGQISFVPIDTPSGYTGEGPNGLTNMSECCIYGGNLSSPQRHLFLYARNLTSDSYDSSATLQVYSGGDIHKPYIEAECIKSDGNTSSWTLDSDGLSVTGNVTINAGTLTIDIGSDRRVTLGVASY